VVAFLKTLQWTVARLLEASLDGSTTLHIND
jgi:hypothetical protein